MILLPVHAAPPEFLVTLLLGKQPVEEELSVLLRVGAEEGGGVDVEPLALAVVSHVLAGLLTSQLAVMVKSVNILKYPEVKITTCPII